MASIKPVYLLAGGMVAAAGVYYLATSIKRKAEDITQDIGATTANIASTVTGGITSAAGGAALGGIFGIAESLGRPKTSPTLCEEMKKTGSLYWVWGQCPAGEVWRYLTN